MSTQTNTRRGAPLTWRVLGMTADAAGKMIALASAGGLALTCGHYHDTQAEAEACPWEPDAPPAMYAGIVRQVRDERPDRAAGRYRWAQGAMPW